MAFVEFASHRLATLKLLNACVVSFFSLIVEEGHLFERSQMYFLHGRFHGFAIWHCFRQLNVFAMPDALSLVAKAVGFAILVAEKR